MNAALRALCTFVITFLAACEPDLPSQVGPVEGDAPAQDLPASPLPGPTVSSSPPTGEVGPGDPARGGKVLVSTDNFAFDENDAEYELDIVDPNGMLLHTQPVSYGSIDTLRLEPGTYSLIVRKRLCDGPCEPGYVSEWWELCQGRMVVPDVPFDRFSDLGSFVVLVDDNIGESGQYCAFQPMGLPGKVLTVDAAERPGS